MGTGVRVLGNTHLRGYGFWVVGYSTHLRRDGFWVYPGTGGMGFGYLPGYSGILGKNLPQKCQNSYLIIKNRPRAPSLSSEKGERGRSPPLEIQPEPKTQDTGRRLLSLSLTHTQHTVHTAPHNHTQHSYTHTITDHRPTAPQVKAAATTLKLKAQ